MPGKLKVTGDTKVPNDPMLVKAYCEGRALAAAGGSANPHPANSPNNLAFAAGIASWIADPAGALRDCCDLPYGGGFVAP